jgi:hypothetical protein
MSLPGATRRPRALGWLLSPLLAAWLGCVSPTLPPDDPPEPEVELGTGVAYLRGAVPAAPAIVLVHNRATGLVFGQRTLTGAYAFEVPTQPCDLLAFWYETPSFQSTSLTFFPAELAGPRDACRNGDVEESDAGR